MNDQGEDATGKPIDRQGLTFGSVFWAIILFMAAATLALALIAAFRPPEGPEVLGDAGSKGEHPTVKAGKDYPEGKLKEIFERASTEGSAAAKDALDRQLDDLYAPVYEGIETYADFHYSVLGEYVELSTAAMGQMERVIQERLFADFQSRLETMTSNLDDRFETAYGDELKRGFEELPEGATFEGIPAGQITADTRARLKTTVPVASAAVALGGVAALKVSSKAMAKRIATAVAAKAAAKGVAKGTGILGGAGAGAAGGGLIGGPVGAVVGGAIGAVGTWLAVDHVIIKIDEFFNREEFEAELAAMVDEHKAMVVEQLEKAIEARREQLSDFTLETLTGGNKGAQGE